MFSFLSIFVEIPRKYILIPRRIWKIHRVMLQKFQRKHIEEYLKETQKKSPYIFLLKSLEFLYASLKVTMQECLVEFLLDYLDEFLKKSWKYHCGNVQRSNFWANLWWTSWCLPVQILKKSLEEYMKQIFARRKSTEKNSWRNFWRHSSGNIWRKLCRNIL